MPPSEKISSTSQPIPQYVIWQQRPAASPSRAIRSWSSRRTSVRTRARSVLVEKGESKGQRRREKEKVRPFSERSRQVKQHALLEPEKRAEVISTVTNIDDSLEVGVLLEEGNELLACRIAARFIVNEASFHRAPAPKRPD